jgi:excinuclease ABC subunit A
MWFLPPVARICEACGGSGYRREAAEIAARGSTLAEAEAATIEEVAAAWEDVPAVARATGPALRLGLGYLAVRQPGWALSGGEAQRLAIARVLGRRNAGPSLYLLDEPTVGLHATDVERLAGVLQELVGAGHSVVVVEHDAQLLAACDWLIELGPGAGPDGGRVVFEGTPEELAATATATAPYVGERLA